MPYSVYLKKNEEREILAGRPRVYANEVVKIVPSAGPPAKNGDIASVYTSDGRFLGRGYINHGSKILVRIMIRGQENENTVPDRDFYIERIRRALEYRRRAGCGDSFRAVFAEADGLPGLIADKYGDLLSVQLLTLGAERDRELIADALCEVFAPRGIYERSDTEARAKEGLPLRSGPLRGDFDPRTVITENGLKIPVDLAEGQKTGGFLDQRENRLAVRRYSAGAEVLDCFCNSGGFSLNAAAGGAKAVTAADISERALETVREAASMNGFGDVITTRRCDVFALLRELRDAGKSFDMLILDPPAFCKSVSEIPGALRGYADINLLGMKLVKSGGFLVSASCTHFITREMFERMLRGTAAASGRTVRIAESRGQPPDHPALFGADESSYLKFYVLNII